MPVQPGSRDVVDRRAVTFFSTVIAVAIAAAAALVVPYVLWSSYDAISLRTILFAAAGVGSVFLVYSWVSGRAALAETLRRPDTSRAQEERQERPHPGRTDVRRQHDE